MSKVKAEYIWMDGHEPTQKLRSKTKVIEGPISSSGASPFSIHFPTPMSACT